MHTLGLFFGWPAGGVYSNLVASVICVAVAWWRIRARLIAHHAQALAQSARHHKTAMAHAQACHDALTLHVTGALAEQAAVVSDALGASHEAVQVTLAAMPPANVTNHFHAAPEPPKRAARGTKP